MSSTGTITSISIGLRWPASTIVTGRGPSVVCPPRKRAISSSGRCVADKPMRCGGVSVSCSRRSSEIGEVRAAFRRRHRVDLVDDHPPHAPERLARLRRQHQVERLRRGDEDVGWSFQHLASLVRRRVAGADRDRRLVREGESRRGRRRARCRRAAPGGSSRRPRPARGAARCRGRACARAPEAAARPRAGRSPTGTRRASCPSRWERGSACGRRARSTPSHRAEQGWARRTWRRTTRGPRGRRRRASPAHRTRTHGQRGSPR